MKCLINIFGLLCMAQVALADSQQIQQYPLDEYQVYEIAVSYDRVTTISFPGPIEAIDAANVTTDGKVPGLFQIAHVKGAYFFSVRALAKKAVTNVNVRWNGKTYALELHESDAPFYSVIFEYQDDAVTPPIPVAVTPERLLALLDKAKAYPLLKAFHPEAVANVEYATYPKKSATVEYKLYAVTIDEGFRFNPEDTLIFRVTLTNETDQIEHYRPDGFSLRVGDRIYPQSISDAAGSIPPHSIAPAYFAVTGTPDGGRNDISLKNNFMVILSAWPDGPVQIGPIAPTNSVEPKTMPNEPAKRH
ncbi:MAG TPA: hypothetical protein VH280_16920 [Verrucomicrobiae bacterium]|nr:hypothetical protein [Verrucomicrobiae bacterium]